MVPAHTDNARQGPIFSNPQKRRNKKEDHPKPGQTQQLNSSLDLLVRE